MIAPRLVLIEWLDSLRPAEEWGYLSGSSWGQCAECKSVGWLVHDGDDVKALAPNVGDIEQPDRAQACGIIRIPARSITRMVELRELKRRAPP